MTPAPADHRPDLPPIDLPPIDLPLRGRLVGGEHRYPLRVYFEDTDVSGVAYHANYLRWMERARTEMLRVVGIDHGGAVAAAAGSYAVAALSIRYAAPARLDDALVVASRLGAVRAASLVVQQRVSRGPLVLAAADVTVAWLGPDGRPRRQPPAWLALYRGLPTSPAPLGDA